MKKDLIIDIGASLNISTAHHVLIAGATGSGKSVCMNKIITEIIKKDKNCEIALIDIKRVELSPYKNINQCVFFANDIDKAERVVKWAAGLMEARYQYMEERNQRKWENQNVYIFIDEFADVSVNSKTFSAGLASIARLGRAAGIHLIIATQYPTREVINSQIKYNLPTRICFKTSAVGSRVVLDHQGAEKLRGKGHGIIQQSDGSERIFQCDYISDEEINEVIEENRSHDEYNYLDLHKTDFTRKPEETKRKWFKW